MEEPDSILLHYQMLEYLYRKCKLATSCFNHTWEGFLQEYSEYQDSLTESDLKNIFWTQVAPNIEQYVLLTEEQAEYFHHDGQILDLSDENLIQTIQNNEPKKEDDYLCWKSEAQVGTTTRRAALTDRNIQKIFDEPNIAERTDRIKLNIIEQKPPSELRAEKSFIKSLEALFLTQNDILSNVTELLEDEIINRMRNPDINPAQSSIFADTLLLACMSMENQASTGISNETSIPAAPELLPFPSDIQASQSTHSLATTSDSSMSILAAPNVTNTRTPTRSLTRSLSQTTPTSINRRSALQMSKSMTPSRATRSRRALVPEPAMNLKMSKFMEMHTKKNK